MATIATKTPLPVQWNVPRIFVERLGQQAGRQRAMVADGHLLLVLHAPPRPGETTRAGRFFWRQPDGTWLASQGDGSTAIRQHLEEFNGVLDRLERRAEESSGAEENFAVLQELIPVERSTSGLLRALQEARERLPDARDLIDLRDQAGDLDMRAELLYKLTTHSLDYRIALRAEEQARSELHLARSTYRLNVMAAIFLPLLAITAVFSTTFEHGLERWNAPGPFLAMLGLGLLLSLILWLRIDPVPERSKARRAARGGWGATSANGPVRHRDSRYEGRRTKA